MRYILFMSTIIFLGLGFVDKSNSNEYGNVANPDDLVKQAFSSYLLGNNEAARKAYNEAKVLYGQVQDRLGEANVTQALESLEGKFRTSWITRLLKIIFENKEWLFSGVGLAIFALMANAIRNKLLANKSVQRTRKTRR